MLTTAQVNWAKSHDWFVRDNGNGTIQVLDRWTQMHADKSVTSHEERINFTEGFRALRDWAGY